MDTSNYLLIGLPFMGSLFLFNFIFLSHRLRRRIHPGKHLSPNQLLTTYPIHLLEGKRSLLYHGSYWNHLKEFLTEHGHEVNSSRQLSPNKWGKNHIFFSRTEIKSAKKISKEHPEKVASLNFVYSSDADLNYIEEQNFKHFINPIKINTPEPKLNRLLNTGTQLSLSLMGTNKYDTLALGSYQTREYYDQILNQSSELAVRDLRD